MTRRQSWMGRAACRGVDLEIFYPAYPTRSEGGRSRAVIAAAMSAVAEAKQVCASCPVIGECRAYALAAREEYGVWGGLSAEDRHALRRRTS